MAEETSKNNSSKYITILLAVVIIIAVGVYAYTHFVKKEPTSPDNNQPEGTLLTITVGSKSYNYSLNNFTAFSSITGQGSYINKIGKITGPNNYTGVSVSVLLSTIPSLTSNYTFQAIANDNYSINYTIDELNGHVIIFNETGGEIGTGNLTMIIAYKENGVYLNETTKGPLRIAFVGTEPALTDSALWLGYLVKIDLI